MLRDVCEKLLVPSHIERGIVFIKVGLSQAIQLKILGGPPGSQHLHLQGLSGLANIVGPVTLAPKIVEYSKLSESYHHDNRQPTRQEGGEQSPTMQQPSHALSPFTTAACRSLALLLPQTSRLSRAFAPALDQSKYFLRLTRHVQKIGSPSC